MRGAAMNPWVGAAIAAVAGFYLGFLVAAILTAGKENGEQIEPLSEEFQRMRENLRSLQR